MLMLKDKCLLEIYVTVLISFININENIDFALKYQTRQGVCFHMKTTGVEENKELRGW